MTVLDMMQKLGYDISGLEVRKYDNSGYIDFRTQFLSNLRDKEIAHLTDKQKLCLFNIIVNEAYPPEFK